MNIVTAARIKLKSKGKCVISREKKWIKARRSKAIHQNPYKILKHCLKEICHPVKAHRRLYFMKSYSNVVG
jgi:hypothetical protein